MKMAQWGHQRYELGIDNIIIKIGIFINCKIDVDQALKS
jgi:hypothetical protein